MDAGHLYLFTLGGSRFAREVEMRRGSAGFASALARGYARSLHIATLGLLCIVVAVLMSAGCGSGGDAVSPSGGPVGGGNGGGNAGGGGGGTFASTAIVTNGGTPQPGVMVTLSRGGSGNGADVVATVATDAEGRAAFPGLTSGAMYCYSARIASENRQYCTNRNETPVRLAFGQ
jgi:hypothetical protein